MSLWSVHFFAAETISVLTLVWVLVNCKFRANAAWEAAKTDKEGADGEKEELNTKIAELEHEVRIKTSEADLFKGNMANILSTPDLTVEPTFEAIRDHIKNNHTQFVNR